MIVLTALSLLVSLLTVAQDPRSLGVPQVPLMVGLFFMICASRMLNGWLGGGYDALLEFSVQFVSFILILVSANGEGKIRWLGASVAFVAIYYGVRGMLALSFGVDTDKFVLQQGAGEVAGGTQEFVYRTRGLGVLEDPNDLAQVLLTAMPFVWMLWRRRSFARNLFLVVLPTAFLLFAVYQTASRGSLIGLFVLTSLLLKDKIGLGGPLVGAGFAAFLILVVGFGGGRTYSATSGSGGGRLELWSDSIGLFKESPIWGIGFNTITSRMPLTSHNSWVLCFTELGVIGFFFWVGLLVVTVLQLRRIIALKKQVPDAEGLAKLANAILLALSAWMATAWFLSRTYSISFYILLGMAAATWGEAKRRFPGLEGLTFARFFRLTTVTMAATFVTVYLLVRFRWAN
jgi:hypothetical protein